MHVCMSTCLCFDLNDFYVGSKGWLEASGATFAPALARPHYHPGVPVYGKLASVVLALPKSVAGSSSIRPLGVLPFVRLHAICAFGARPLGGGSNRVTCVRLCPQQLKLPDG